VVENLRPRAFQIGELPEGRGDHGGRALPLGIVEDERLVAEPDGGEGAGCAGVLVAGVAGFGHQKPTPSPSPDERQDSASRMYLASMASEAWRDLTRISPRESLASDAVEQ